jgi:hypothetical protein
MIFTPPDLFCISVVYQLQIGKNGSKTFRRKNQPFKRTKIIPVDVKEETKNVVIEGTGEQRIVLDDHSFYIQRNNYTVSFF